MNDKNKINLLTSLKNLLLESTAKTQHEISQSLKKQGYTINQTKVSRLLRKLGAAKVKNELGQITYWLPKEPPPLETSEPISSLVIDITYNEHIIVIHTTPGAAQLIARLLDYRSNDLDILGTIAGDDTVFVVPKTSNNMKRKAKLINELVN